MNVHVVCISQNSSGWPADDPDDLMPHMIPMTEFTQLTEMIPMTEMTQMTELTPMTK